MQPAAADAPHQVDVLHQGEGAKAAQRLIKFGRDQQALVAVGQTEHPVAPGHPAREAPGAGAVVVEGEAKDPGPAPVVGIGDE